ncbi:MAG: peptidase U32 family protein [Prolixibacteraceae bacterium]|nr:peptidase U32 family protein [Prolixibacteraceae bacterium]
MNLKVADKKPELLLPAGNVESFYAATRGGADAIFLGLRSFNARGRAMNFSNAQLLAALQEARQKNIKIYVTLNTVIKNAELKDLIDTLSFLSKARVDAIIIQDWGVYLIARRFFPKLKIHASTQMGNHNSDGVNFNASRGISRTILARELTMPELERISEKINSEIELFVHGALCYSFSGMCLFSSYQGGQGANRGMCAQPCRMIYRDANKNRYIFSLKDNQQLENLEKLNQCGVRSLKVEGRMKSADYVFQVARAYRLAIDFPKQTGEAAEMLRFDMGREKTSYFLGRNVKNEITNNPNTGIKIGTIEQVEGTAIVLRSDLELKEGNRLRIQCSKSNSPVNLKVSDVFFERGAYRLQNIAKEGISIGDPVFLVGLGNEKFPTKFRNLPNEPAYRWSGNEKQKVFDSLAVKKCSGQPQLFLRIDNPHWFRKIRLTDIDALILKFCKSDWGKTDWQSAFLQENKEKIWVELPKFISEGQLNFYFELAVKLQETGFNRFFISNLSQRLLFQKGAVFSGNENVYVYNDAAARLMVDEGLSDFCYPQENDMENLLKMRNKNGIVPVYFYPELFYSRMPVAINNPENKFKDESGKTFRKTIKNGMTIVIPDVPVSLTQYKKQLQEAGFRKFLIDLSFDTPTSNLIKKVMTRFKSGEQIHPSTTFNFKKGLR